MKTRLLPLLALVPIAACEVPETPAEQAPTQAAPVQVAAAPAVRATPIPVAPRPAVVAAPLAPVAPPTSGLAPPPAADGGAVPAAAPVPAGPSGALGTTVASLGTTEPGLWLETPLVSAPTSGSIEYNGQTVSVQLRPSGGEPGSGSQISLEAMRALGAPLTGLPELTVYGS